MEEIKLLGEISEITRGGNFVFCSNLKRVYLSPTIKSIGMTTHSAYPQFSRNFENLKALELVDFGEGSQITAIGPQTFSGCINVKFANFPKGLATVRQYAFNNCKSMEALTQEECSSLTKLETYAFYGCDNLSTVYLPASCTSVAANAFSATTDVIILGSVANSERTAILSGLTYVKRVIYPREDKNLYETIKSEKVFNVGVNENSRPFCYIF